MLQDIIKQHIQTIDREIDMEGISGKTLLQWLTPLLDSMTEDGAVPYLIGKKERYRASPLSSTLEWMIMANLLPREAISIFQDKLVYLRDSGQPGDPSIVIKNKLPEDSEGWSISEGVSIWSTSVAIIALFDPYQLWEKHKQVIKEAVLWLASQRNIAEDGWAYQNHINCSVNTIMTALALRAIAMAMQKCAELDFSPDEESSLKSALKGGFYYLKNHICQDKKKAQVYWQFQNEAHCTATVWSLLALYELSKLEGNEEVLKFYQEHHISALRFVVSKMPQKSTRWMDEKMVEEGGAKYNKHKNYYSFCAVLLPQLFTLGLSPFHPKVISQIQWLIKNPEEWKIANYDKSKISSFTYAMVLSTIVLWAKSVGRVQSKCLLLEKNGFFSKTTDYVCGIRNDPNSPILIILKKRLISYFISIVILLLMLMKGKSIWAATVCLVNKFFSLLGQSFNSIIVNIVSSILWLFLVALVNRIIKTIKNRRWNRID